MRAFLAAFLAAFPAAALPLTIVLASGSSAFAMNPVLEKEIVLGTSLPMTGQSAPRAMAFKYGSDLFFKRFNDGGGVHGRTVKVIALDDAYEPMKTVENVRKLITQDKVFALFNVFGTPTVKAILPIVERENILMITPVSGARFLRQPPLKQVFTVRASDNQEADAIIRYLVETRKVADIGLFFQDDALGQSGQEAVAGALRERSMSRKVEGTYKRNTSDVDQAVKDISAANPKAVVLWGSGKPSAVFMKKCIEKGFKPIFVASSVVDTPEFAADVAPLNAEVLIAQPLYQLAESKAQIVRDYVKDIGKNKKPSISEFEGYLNAAFFGEAVKRAGRELTQEKLIATIESMKDADVGGIHVSFSPENHTGLSKVSIMKMQKGSFTPIQD